MEHISHLIKRNVMSPRTPRVSQVPQSSQHENEAQPSDQQCRQQQTPPLHYVQLVERQVQAPLPISHQEIHYQHYDPPMTLNAWTQVNSDELPSVNIEMDYIKAKTKELEDRLREQTKLIEEYKKSKANRQESKTDHDNIVSSTSSTYPENANEYSEDEYSGDESFDTSQMSNSQMTTLGPRYTQIPTDDFENISWTSPSVAMRKLMEAVYDRGVLANNTMPGHLNADAMRDIFYIVAKKCGISTKEVRDFLPMKIKCSK